MAVAASEQTGQAWPQATCDAELYFSLPSLLMQGEDGPPHTLGLHTLLLEAVQILGTSNSKTQSPVAFVTLPRLHRDEG